MNNVHITSLFRVHIIYNASTLDTCGPTWTRAYVVVCENETHLPATHKNADHRSGKKTKQKKLQRSNWITCRHSKKGQGSYCRCWLCDSTSSSTPQILSDSCVKTLKCPVLKDPNILKACHISLQRLGCSSACHCVSWALLVNLQAPYILLHGIWRQPIHSDRVLQTERHLCKMLWRHGWHLPAASCQYGNYSIGDERWAMWLHLRIWQP